ncbi:TonB-dependent receptor [Xanthomonas hortorum pv. cynarae]|uniref:TonB-dependent receptor n=1 Tax=Xanthomonas hortorum TaxID=56454 RepID=UPI000CEDDDC4|nr:TonB-dependent receptor [Xanthomonas hortorum]MCE4348355.1 TonB-dependent receptor [Xanthomonas hortorum pv. cynarae]PPU48563.1 TonB-dependent siderophore receptor [Xanthomonas hortorum pv. cynarae]CAD0353476.1 Metal-pseudopaline receptor CntO [Xanthomonas hortorum pv. cynarae]CAD0353482.1 Metal-pseudopaline receptor CntO [Xanthomonas hortorum pv. cynarae]
MSVFSTMPALPSRLAIALAIALSSSFTAHAATALDSAATALAASDSDAVVPGDGATDLSAVHVSGHRRDRPASTGSNLGLTPFEIPASLEVIDRAQLQARGDSNVTDAITRASAISGMPHPGNGLSALSTRGFTDSASVMRLYDGLRQYGGVGVTFPFDTWSIERIEVLKGPASVIYGEGAIGGVINIVPKKPRQDAVENEVQATIGTEDTARLAFGSGGAIDDRLSYRVDASANYTSGWVDRGHSSDATFSGALRWDATAELSLTLNYAYGYQKPMRYFGTPLVDGRVLDALRHKNYNVGDAVMRFKDQWTQLDAVWSPNDAVTLTSRVYHVASKRDWRNAESYVYNTTTALIDRSTNTAINHDQQQTGITSSLVLKGQLGGLENAYSVGLDVNRGRFKHTNNTYVGSSGPVDPYNPVPGFFQSDIPTIPRYRNSADQAALFMEDHLSLTAAWSVLAGLRYDHASLDRQNLVTAAQAFSRDYSSVGWRLGTVYTINPDVAVYAQYSEAADPVGALLMLSPANSAFDMAKGRQTEIGLKQRFWQGAGEWTLAAYRIRKSDLVTRDPADPTVSLQIGSQSSRGVEASLALAVTDQWQLDANATVLRAEFDDFTESVAGRAVSRAGKVPPNVAQRLANVWVSWNFQPNWTAAAGVRYVGKRHADNANALELPAYSTTDLSVSWDIRPATRITTRVVNLFDKAYFTTAYYTDSMWLYGADRRAELTINHRF